MFLSIKTRSALNELAATLYETDRDAFVQAVNDCVQASGQETYSHTSNSITFRPWQEAFLPGLTAML